MTGAAASASRHSAVPTIAVTSGEPAGVGPELCARITQEALPCRLVILADHALFAERAAAMGCSIRPTAYAVQDMARAGTVELLHLPLPVHSSPGQLESANARYVLAQLDRALQGCRGGEFAAMVTAPVHKGVINAAGVPFTGHTEYLAAKTGASHVVMLLVGGGLRVALATTHLALKDVAAALTRAGLERTVRTLAAELRAKFGIAAPRILVTGLNPHAGEGGYLGREEIDVIAPVVNRLRGEGFKVSGPFPADTLFTPEQLAHGDCVLAMYHDQGLPVLKYASFGHGVNVTLGLPIIRTSVDHGTALDLAGTGRADPGSLIAAVETAIQIAASCRPRSIVSNP